MFRSTFFALKHSFGDALVRKMSPLGTTGIHGFKMLYNHHLSYIRKNTFSKTRIL